MSNVVNIPARAQPDGAGIDECARAWVVRLDGEAGTEARQELQQWLQRSPRHVEAFRRAAAAWTDLDDLAGILDRIPAHAATGQASAAAGRRLLPIHRAAVAAALLLITAAGIGLAVHGGLPTDTEGRRFAADYTTTIGELAPVSLPDGSRVELNTRSHMTVLFSRNARLVELLDGEAYFDVAHDPQRPFIVYTGRLAVRAVGTAFSVRVDSSGVDLTIAEGRIEVAALPQPLPSLAALDIDSLKDAVSRVHLEQGQHVVFNDGIELMQRIEPREVERRLSWRDGMLIFDDDPLEKVVAEISRYTSTRIVISDPGLRDTQFGGYFRAGDVSSILATLEESFGIHVEAVDDDLVYLSRRQAGD